MAGPVLTLALVIILSLSGACGPARCPPPFAPLDLSPPSLSSFEVLDGRRIRLGFDEDVLASLDDTTLWSSRGDWLALESLELLGRDIILAASAEQEAGADYRLEARVRDAWGNSSILVLPFAGHNPRPARLLINEIRTDSSKPRSDLVELVVMEGGLCAGALLSAGPRGDAEWSYALPSAELAEGDFIVIHLAPPEGGGALDETGADLGISYGLDACPGARDFWLKEAAALSKSNGILCLYASRQGALMDAFLYSDRTRDSDQKYGGYGSAAFQRRAEAIIASGAWKDPEGLGPGACASSIGTTETRSMGRNSSSFDSDSAADWHIVPTRGASFGSLNSDQKYDPASAKAKKAKVK